MQESNVKKGGQLILHGIRKYEMLSLAIKDRIKVLKKIPSGMAMNQTESLMQIELLECMGRKQFIAERLLDVKFFLEEVVLNEDIETLTYMLMGINVLISIEEMEFGEKYYKLNPANPSPGELIKKGLAIVHGQRLREMASFI